VFRIDLLLKNHAHDFVQQRPILQHQQVRIKDASFLRAHALAHLSLHFQDLLAGIHQRFFQSIDLVAHSTFGNLRLADDGSNAIQDENLPPAHPGRNRNAPESQLTPGGRFGHKSVLTKPPRLEKEFLASHKTLAYPPVGRVD
jgi:hypothetical protein